MLKVNFFVTEGSMKASLCFRDAVVPLLAVFASLFGYLLVTINDTEFYGSNRSNDNTMGEEISSKGRKDMHALKNQFC